MNLDKSLKSMGSMMNALGNMEALLSGVIVQKYLIT